MITTDSLNVLLSLIQSDKAYSVEGSVASGKVSVRYTRPSGLQFGTGCKDHTTVYTKQARKWSATRF